MTSQLAAENPDLPFLQSLAAFDDAGLNFDLPTRAAVSFKCAGACDPPIIWACNHARVRIAGRSRNSSNFEKCDAWPVPGCRRCDVILPPPPALNGRSASGGAAAVRMGDAPAVAAPASPTDA